MSRRSPARVKDVLLEHVSRDIKELQSLQSDMSTVVDMVTNSNRHMQALCEHLDHILMHGLREYEQGYWPFVTYFTRNEAIVTIKQFSNVTTDIGKGRAWLYMALNEQAMESYVRMYTENQDIVQDYYMKEAFLRDMERMLLLQTLMAGLDFISFDLTVDCDYLDYGASEPSSRLGIAQAAELTPDVKPSFISSMSPKSHRRHQGLSMSADFSYESPSEDDQSSLSYSKPILISGARIKTATGDTLEQGGDLENREKGGLDVPVSRLKKEEGSVTSSLPSPLSKPSILSRMSSQEYKSHSGSKDLTQSLTVSGSHSGSRDHVSEAQGLLEEWDEPVVHVSKQRKSKPKRRKKKRKPEEQSLRSSDVAQGNGSQENSITSLGGESERIPAVGMTTGRGEESPTTGESKQLWTEEDIDKRKPALSEPSPREPALSEPSVPTPREPALSEPSVPTPREPALSEPSVPTPKEPASSELSVLTEPLGPYQEGGVDQPDSSHGWREGGRLEVDGGSLEQLQSPREEVRILTPDEDVELDWNEGRERDEPTWEETAPLPPPSRPPHSTDDYVIISTEEEGWEMVTSAGRAGLNIPPHGLNIPPRGRGEGLGGVAQSPSSLASPITEVIVYEDLPERPKQITEMDRRAADVNYDDNTRLVFQLDIFFTADEQIQRLAQVNTPCGVGLQTSGYVLISAEAVYLLRKDGIEGFYSRELGIKYSEFEHIVIGLGWQSFILVYQHSHETKTCVILTGSEAISRSLVDSIRTSAANCPSFRKSIPLNRDDDARIDAIEKELIKQGSQTSMDIVQYSLVNWEELNGEPPKISPSSHRQSVRKSGILQFKSTNVLGMSVWKSGHFQIRDGVLYQYNSETDKVARSTYHLRKCGGCTRSVGESRPYSFSVLGRDGPMLVLATSSEEELSLWMQALCEAVTERRDSLSPMPKRTALSCAILLTQNKIHVLQEDWTNESVQLVTSCEVTDVNGMSVDRTLPLYCTISYDHQDSQGLWLVCFNSEYELGKFESALAATWREHFQIDPPFTEVSDPVQKERAHKAVELMQCSKYRSDSVTKGRTEFTYDPTF